MFIKRYLKLIVIVVVILVFAAAFFIGLNWYERVITARYLEEQQEVAKALDARFEEIRQEKIAQEQALSAAALFVQEYLNRKDIYSASINEIEERAHQDVFSVDELRLLAESRIEISREFKEYLRDQSDNNEKINDFIVKKIEFLEKDIEAYELIRSYYDFFEVSFTINEAMIEEIDNLLIESLKLEAEVSFMLQEVIREYELDHLFE